MLISGYTDLTYAMKPEESLPPDIMARGSCSAGGVCVAVGPALGGADGQKGQERRARDERHSVFVFMEDPLFRFSLDVAVLFVRLDHSMRHGP